MKAMVFDGVGEPLRLREIPIPRPRPAEVLIEITACGVCRTDLHIVDGELTSRKLPLVPGHEIVGRIVELGEGVDTLQTNMRVGVPWLGHTCGVCPYCRSGVENLCDRPQFTGYTREGGYAEACVADASYVLALPDGPSDAELAPLLCAGLIGYRSLRMAGDTQRIGLYGFGAAAHLVAQVARWQGRRVFAFTRPGDAKTKAFAKELGAVWAGDSNEQPPEQLDAAIIFAPVGALVPTALRAIRKGGSVVCAGIHMSDIPSFPYKDLWQERSVRSVANLTRRDGLDFLSAASKAGVRTSIETFPLNDANEALQRLREGRVSGAAVLTMV
ncbi:MAG: zinc-dependent alcohol dehydrogenase family protein [Geminicoccaceae bacterium]